MSAQVQQPKTSNVLALLGALAFTLSALPGWHQQDKGLNGLDLSSLGCDINSQLQSANTAKCKIEDVRNGQKYTGYITVNLEDVRNVRRDPKDQQKFIEETTKGWHIQVHDLETECGSGCENGRLQGETLHKTVAFDELRNVGQIAALLAKQASDVLVSQAVREKKLADKRERCEVDNSDQPISTERERLRCQMVRVKELGSEKGADYFDRYVQPKLEEWASSGNPADLRMLREVTNGRGRGSMFGTNNPYINRSLTQLRQYAEYNVYAQSYADRIANPQTAADRAMARQQLGDLLRTSGSSFTREAGYVQNLQNPNGWSEFNLGDRLYDDVMGSNGYWPRLYDQYNTLADYHRNLLNGTNSQPLARVEQLNTPGSVNGTIAGQQQPAQARQLWGSPTQFPSTGAAAPAMGASTQFPVGQQLQQPQIIRMPVPGQPVMGSPVPPQGAINQPYMNAPSAFGNPLPAVQAPVGRYY